MNQLKKMAEFLGVSASEDFLDQVIQKCSFSHMRATKGAQESFKEGQTSPIMYRKGDLNKAST